MGCNNLIATQVEIGKRERMLACAEIEGLKKYHFKEMHELQDQLLAQRSVVSKLTLKVQEASQVHPYMINSDKLAALLPPSCAKSHCLEVHDHGHSRHVYTAALLPLVLTQRVHVVQGGQQATILQDEIVTMRQSHGISMKRLQVNWG